MAPNVSEMYIIHVITTGISDDDAMMMMMLIIIITS